MKRVWGFLRVVGVAMVLLALGVTLTARSASAHLVESMRGLGDQITRLHELRPHSAPRRLVLNGLGLRVMTASTPLEIDEALDRFQSLCHSVVEVDLPATVRQRLAEQSRGAGLDSTGVIRRQAEHEGFLACINLDHTTDGEGLLARLKAFGATGNLRSLGQFRYALARRQADVTTLVMFWTEGDARLGEMFPREGDAPGRDLVAVPRPPEARRILSGFEEGLPYGFAVYEAAAAASPEEARNDYTAHLLGLGWRTQITSNGLVVAKNAGQTVVVRASENSARRVTLGLFAIGHDFLKIRTRLSEQNP